MLPRQLLAVLALIGELVEVMVPLERYTPPAVRSARLVLTAVWVKVLVVELTAAMPSPFGANAAAPWPAWVVTCPSSVRSPAD